MMGFKIQFQTIFFNNIFIDVEGKYYKSKLDNSPNCKNKVIYDCLLICSLFFCFFICLRRIDVEAILILCVCVTLWIGETESGRKI